MNDSVAAAGGFALPADSLTRLDAVVSRYPTRESALMPALWIVQDELGHIPPAAVTWLAARLEVPEARVWEVITFYTMYRSEPQAKYVLQVCRTLSCALNGAERVTDVMSRKLGIKPGETDAEGLFTLIEAECLGACDRAPVILVNDHWHECLKPEDAERLVDDLRSQGPGVLSGCHLCVDKGSK